MMGGLPICSTHWQEGEIGTMKDLSLSAVGIVPCKVLHIKTQTLRGIGKLQSLFQKRKLSILQVTLLSPVSRFDHEFPTSLLIPMPPIINLPTIERNVEN